METNNIDSKFKNIISENQDFYDTHAGAAKDNIWASISAKQKRKTGNFLIYSLSAACIVLLILSSVLGILLLNNKNIIQQAPLNPEISKNLDKHLKRDQPIYIFDTIRLTDTIILTKPEIIYKKVEITNNITDTVFINQIEYLEIGNPLDQYITEEKIQTPEDSNTSTNSTEILINNSDSEIRNQKPKAKFRFGIAKNQNSNGSLAITTNL